MKMEKLSDPAIESISRIIGDAFTGSDITRMFNNSNVQDVSNESTKWKRLYYSFQQRQNNDGCSNAFLLFIQNTMSPERYVNEGQQKFENLRTEINKVLMLYGIEINDEGKMKKIIAATSVSEVERRTRSLVNELSKRVIHYSVIACCKEEYLQDNYFHAVLEASKSLSDHVREMTGINEDGTKLFDQALSTNNPIIAINRLETSSERNQQNGLREMLNGITHMVRNVTAHELKIKWIVNEKEAIDILTTISFLHKLLDECFVVPKSY